jgi:hypothetical protein
LPAVVPVEAEVEEASEVDGGGSDAEGEAVAVDAAVSAAAVAVGDEPGDGAFDHGPVLSVVVDEDGVASPSAPVCGQEFVMLGDEERLAGGG